MSQGVDPESEVRKLQELVKKLERQNVRLRKQHSEPDSVMSESVTSNMSEISEASTISAPLSSVPIGARRSTGGSSGKRTFTVEVDPIVESTNSATKISARDALSIVADSVSSRTPGSNLLMSCTSEPLDADSHRSRSTKTSVSTTGDPSSPAPSKPPQAPARPKQRSKSSVGAKPDDCWLKKVENVDTQVENSVLPWMREVFDKPTVDIVQAKQRLQTRLEEFRLTGRLFAAGSQPSLVNYGLNKSLSHHKTLPDVRVEFDLPSEKPLAIEKRPERRYSSPKVIQPTIQTPDDSSCGSADSLETPSKSQTPVQTRKPSVLDIARRQEEALKAAATNYWGRKGGSTGDDLNVASPNGSKQNLYNQPLDSTKRSISGYQIDERQRSKSIAGITFDETKRSTSGQDLYQPHRPMATIQPMEDNQTWTRSPSGQPRVHSNNTQHVIHPKRSVTDQQQADHPNYGNISYTSQQLRSQQHHQSNQLYTQQQKLNQSSRPPQSASHYKYRTSQEGNQQSNQMRDHQYNDSQQTKLGYPQQYHQQQPRNSAISMPSDRMRHASSGEHLKVPNGNIDNPQPPPRRHRQTREDHTESMPQNKSRYHVSPNGRLDTTRNSSSNRNQNPSPSRISQRKTSVGAITSASSSGGNSDLARSRGFRSVHQINENF